MPGGKAFRQPVQFGKNQAVHGERVRGRELGNAETDRVISVEHQVRTVVLGAQFGAAYISQPNQGSIRVGFQNDVFKLRRFGEPADGAHADLKFLPSFNRGLSHLSGGDVYVLLLQGADRIRRRQPAAGHAHRIQPQPHGILALAEDDDVCNSGHPLQRVLYIDVEVVAHEERRVAFFGRKHSRAQDEIVGGLGDGDAGGFDRVGQPSLGGVHAVLNVDRGQVGIAIQVKSRRDRARSVAAAGRSDVLHSLRAVDLLLQRHRHRGFHGLSAGSDVEAAHGNLRRRQRGKLRDRQRGNYRRARQNNQQRADGGKDGTSYEEVNEHLGADLGPRASDLGRQTSDFRPRTSDRMLRTINIQTYEVSIDADSWVRSLMPEVAVSRSVVRAGPKV